MTLKAYVGVLIRDVLLEDDISLIHGLKPAIYLSKVNNGIEKGRQFNGVLCGVSAKQVKREYRSMEMVVVSEHRRGA